MKKLCAAFWTDALGSELRGAVPALVRLTSSPDAKTRANAAAALSNLVRHGGALCPVLVSAGALQVRLPLHAASLGMLTA